MMLPPARPYGFLEVRRAGRVVNVVLLRPSSLNALTLEMLTEIDAVLAEVEADDGVRALTVTGAGEAFCVGGDTAQLERGLADRSVMETFIAELNRVLLRLEELPVPTIAAVNGTAHAGGLEVALACDLCLVAREARLADRHAVYGLMPGGGATYRLARRIGEQAARELILTGRWVTGDEAAEMGLALRAVERARLDDETAALARAIAEHPRATLAAIKAAMIRTRGLPSASAAAVESGLLLDLVGSTDLVAEGYRAAREHRPPRWRQQV